MKISLIGHGKTGKIVEKYALERGHQICSIITSKDNLKHAKEADICIDFSHPEATLDIVQELAKMGKNVVIGTTGWYNRLPEVEEIVKHSKIGLLYSPNFSVGVQLFNKILAEASKIMQHQKYDIAGREEHHSQKVDAPSGTALKLAHTIYNETGKEISFSSTRCGSIPGTHTVLFDSHWDTITLTHQARNREGFAEGAVIAAEWLLGKSGLFGFEDALLHNSNKNHRGAENAET